MTAAAALQRLRGDKALRALAQDRSRLHALTLRLEIAGRGVLTRELAARVRTEPRFAPVLRGLVRLSLS